MMSSRRPDQLLKWFRIFFFFFFFFELWLFENLGISTLSTGFLEKAIALKLGTLIGYDE